MFTGIIEATGIIREIVSNGSNKTFRITSSLVPELKIDQSISHNGACLTVENLDGSSYTVTAIEETLRKTTLGHWKQGDIVNLERCMVMNGRLDGHIVQGHVDATGECIEKKTLNGSWQYTFRFPSSFAKLIIEKGSISLNGISLTIFDISENTFSVAIIPYTYEYTNMKHMEKGSLVNLEFDMVGKYIKRILER